MLWMEPITSWYTPVRNRPWKKRGEARVQFEWVGLQMGHHTWCTARGSMHGATCLSSSAGHMQGSPNRRANTPASLTK